MIDRCGRNIDYLRISVTDRCNLRCIYCMPEEGVQHVERSLILQEEEILRICRVMAELGIRKIKLTGGEPLVRPRMPQLVEKLKNMPGIEKVTLTTNGVLLKDQMSDFAWAGLDGLISAWIRWMRPAAGGSRGGMNWGGRWKGFRRQ